MLPGADDRDGRRVGQTAAGDDVAEVPEDLAIAPGDMGIDPVGGVVRAQLEGRLVGVLPDVLPELDGDLRGGDVGAEARNPDIGGLGQRGGRQGRVEGQRIGRSHVGGVVDRTDRDHEGIGGGQGGAGGLGRHHGECDRAVGTGASLEGDRRVAVGSPERDGRIPDEVRVRGRHLKRQGLDQVRIAVGHREGGRAGRSLVDGLAGDDPGIAQRRHVVHRDALQVEAAIGGQGSVGDPVGHGHRTVEIGRRRVGEVSITAGRDE